MKTYSNVSAMEPMLPSRIPLKLEELSVEIIRLSSKLGAMVHPVTRSGLADLFREMNSYYSNLIEGHKTRPIDIQKALKHNFSANPVQRILQEESIAHIQVQKMIEQKLFEEPNIEICSENFLCWIHEEFYKRLPESLKIVQGDGLQEIVLPGKLRTHEVQVGQHIPPRSDNLIQFINRFEQVYTSDKLSSILQIIAVACSHHRLAWIHPFLDGNGRVIRLFSDAYFMKIKVDGHGLWTISRGLARNKAAYMSALADADSHRRGDLDGRGNLSEQGLIQFCYFFLKTALDQINFMISMLEIEELKNRIESYINFLNSKNQIRIEAAVVLKEVFVKGEITRGTVSEITNMSERSARDLIRTLLERDLLLAKTPKGALRMGFPADALEFYFPRLYNTV